MGGRSSRMRATHGATHKALIPVLGIPMIERNILTLVAHGYLDLIVAVNSSEAAVRSYVQKRGSTLVAARGGKIKMLEEQEALGTIGAAGAVTCASSDLLVVNVDNLTSLDLAAFVA